MEHRVPAPEGAEPIFNDLDPNLPEKTPGYPPAEPRTRGIGDVNFGFQRAMNAVGQTKSPANGTQSTRSITSREMITASLILPTGSTLTGRPVTLLEVLSATPDRRTQVEVIHAYWRLVSAVATYRAAWDETRQLDEVQGNASDESLLRASKASSLAALETAKLAAIGAQYELAEMAALRTDSMLLPLPADPPHVGSYNTFYKQLTATRALPPRLRLLDRMLPLGRQAIDVRASALQASADTFLALSDAYQVGGASLIEVLDSLKTINASQRSLVETACQYNHDIVDYALSVVSPSTQGEALVAMLIQRKTAHPTSNTGARRTTFERTGEEASGVDQAGYNQPTLAPSRASVEWKESGHSIEPIVPAEESYRPPLETTVRRPGVPTSLFQPLANLEPSKQAKRLAASLYSQRAIPDSVGTPTALEDCLLGLSRAQCRKTVEEYWLAAHRAAAYQVLVDKRALIDELSLVSSARTDASAEDANRLRSAQESVDAKLLDAHRSLIEAVYDLTLSAGRSTDEAWLVPQTIPHAGGYRLELDALPRELAESWPIRRLAVSVPTMADHVLLRAALVVEADAIRTAASVDYQAGTQSLDDVLALLERQVSATDNYLAALTDYNRAIAEYSTRVLPGNLPRERLIKTLVSAP